MTDDMMNLRTLVEKTPRKLGISAGILSIGFVRT